MPKKSRRMFFLFLPLPGCAGLDQALGSPAKQEQGCLACLRGSGSAVQDWEGPQPCHHVSPGGRHDLQQNTEVPLVSWEPLWGKEGSERRHFFFFLICMERYYQVYPASSHGFGDKEGHCMTGT